MKILIMKYPDYARQHLRMLTALLLVGVLIFMAAGCDEIDGGTVQKEIELPTDSTLNFYCENEGVFPDECVLDNPENPYARVNITEDNKFELQDAAPSAKSRYYLWATALAKGAGIQGENQFYTALSLHEVFAESGSPTTRDQAKKAYRSVLDNFFLSVTFFGPFTSEEVFVPVTLKDVVGEFLYDPTSASLVSLYDDPAIALADMGEWGYVYDTTNKIVSVFR
jgi:hypothetical protein